MKDSVSSSAWVADGNGNEVLVGSEKLEATDAGGTCWAAAHRASGNSVNSGEIIRATASRKRNLLRRAFLTASTMSASRQSLLSGDDNNDEELPPLRTGHAVRFKEDVQVIAPSLRSTTASREAGRYGTPSSNPIRNQLTS